MNGTTLVAHNGREYRVHHAEDGTVTRISYTNAVMGVCPIDTTGRIGRAVLAEFHAGRMLACRENIAETIRRAVSATRTSQKDTTK